MSNTLRTLGALVISKTAEWVAKNPGAAACVAVGVGGLAVVASPALVTAPVLGAVGFGSNGVIAGSAAATAQAGIGNVVAPSAFATLTSAGMGGYGAATVAAVGQGIGVATGALGGLAAWKLGKKN
ncbi:hypothetical protein B0H66DRAFT_609057 [Apodospora peruviana]|uniref:Uncharacterized protein n=1 Tax=Apodospora peruviana TaxID=516989 RepID=A0AAE0HS11_9PEZI|nr:hypothetical protein B0H66DRAFT_609057 [Apodospora peruviana]